MVLNHTPGEVVSGIALDVAGPTGIITLDRPPVNAMDFALQARLFDVARQVAADEDVRAVVIRGAGAAFSAGADIEQMARTSANPARFTVVRGPRPGEGAFGTGAH
ncbi:enoyl-CoA hydratase-related protein [Saccharopolyspora hirsuta]|uniref:enoyl-CoA hydratase-related protein n=1 Tax=Saccharopolyspora hirsuta TaxID=1837 RepID=UPI00331783C1